MNDLDEDHSNPKLARYTWFEESGGRLKNNDILRLSQDLG